MRVTWASSQQINTCQTSAVTCFPFSSFSGNIILHMGDLPLKQFGYIGRGTSLQWKSLQPFWYVRGEWPWVTEVWDQRETGKGVGGASCEKRGGRGYLRTSWGQEDGCWCWMPGRREKQHHVLLLFTPHHSTVIVSSDLLVSAQNKRMDLSPNCSHNKGVCFIREVKALGHLAFSFGELKAV